MSISRQWKHDDIATQDYSNPALTPQRMDTVSAHEALSGASGSVSLVAWVCVLVSDPVIRFWRHTYISKRCHSSLRITILRVQTVYHLHFLQCGSSATLLIWLVPSGLTWYLQSLPWQSIFALQTLFWYPNVSITDIDVRQLTVSRIRLLKMMQVNHCWRKCATETLACRDLVAVQPFHASAETRRVCRANLMQALRESVVWIRGSKRLCASLPSSSLASLRGWLRCSSGFGSPPTTMTVPHNLQEPSSWAICQQYAILGKIRAFLSTSMLKQMF